MAQAHIGSAQVVMVRPVSSPLSDERTMALVKTEDFELIRMILPEAKEISEHVVDGPVILHCLEGRVSLTVNGEPLELAAGELVHLDPRSPHALRAIENSAVLLTIIFRGSASRSHDVTAT